MPAVLVRKPVSLAPLSLLAVCSSRGDRNENDQTVVQRLLTRPAPHPKKKKKKKKVAGGGEGRKGKKEKMQFAN